MHQNNVSFIFLLGFPNFYSFKHLLFFFLLIVFFVTMFGNVLIITVVSVNPSLHSPMYLFITLISLLDIMMTMDILPMLLHIVLNEGGFMSLTGCLLQFYVMGNVETAECLILMVMSYDRYIAICNPLRYNAIVNKKTCVESIFLLWLFSFLLLLMNEIFINNLDFCGPNIIDHFFCDLVSIIELSCSDILMVQTQTTIISSIVILTPFVMIIVSYMYIIFNILNIKSTSGRQKAFSTCSSHLTAVLIFYGSLFSVYIAPTKGKLSTANKTLSLLYTVVTPFLNPFIYSLRNTNLKKALLRKYTYFRLI